MKEGQVVKKTSIAISLSAIIISGCAENSENIQATYVSPLNYNSYTCKQIEQEARRVSSRAAQAAGVQDKNAQGDAVATGVALVLFWPAAFFVGGNKQTAAELSRLRGELDALEQVSIQKNCGIIFNKEPAPAAEAAEKSASSSEPLPVSASERAYEATES